MRNFKELQAKMSPESRERSHKKAIALVEAELEKERQRVKELTAIISKHEGGDNDCRSEGFWKIAEALGMEVPE